MKLKIVPGNHFNIGDLVTVKTMPREERFCIIAFKRNERQEPIAVLKALFNDTCIIEKPITELNTLLTKGLL